LDIPSVLGIYGKHSNPNCAYVVFAGQLSGDQRLHRAYHDNPDSCNLSEFMVATNAVSGCRDVVALFYDNKLGVDVDVWSHVIDF